MILTLLAIAAAVSVVAGSSGEAPERYVPGPERYVPGPDRVVPNTGGIKVWGESVTDVGATWRPAYLKTKGKTTLRWGVCIDKWVEDLTRCRGIAWVGKADEVAEWIAKKVNVAAGAIVKWINHHQCARFKWEGVRTYQFEQSAQNAAAGLETDVRYYQVDVAGGPYPGAPPHPLAPKMGFKRVWIQTIAQGAAPMTRSDDAVVVYWPAEEEGGPRIAELCTRDEIRAMMREACGQSGSITKRQLARSAEGKSTWWITLRRRKALSEYK